MRVAIATTEGPSCVQALAEETVPDVQSVVCVDGGADALGISAAYNRFLRRPTGPVEAAFGHRTFRLDVSAGIAGGASWQLGVYAAHALFAAGRLTLDAAAAADTPTLLATGRVNRWGRVGAIEHLSEKLQAARAWLAELRAYGAPCTVAYPNANAADVTPECRADLEGLGVRLLPCADVNELEHALGLAPARLTDDAPPSGQADETGGEQAGAAPMQPTGRSVRGRRVRRLALATLAAALLAAAVGWPLAQALPLVQAARAGDYAFLADRATGRWRTCPGCALFRLWAARQQPDPEVLDLSATAFRPSDRRTCDQARWTGGRFDARTIRLSSADAPVAVSGTRLCALRYDLVNRGGRVLPVVLALRDASDRTLATTGQAALDPGQRIELSVDPGRLIAAGGPFELVAYASGFAPGNLARVLTATPGGALDDDADRRLVRSLALARMGARHDFDAGPSAGTPQVPVAPRFQ